MDNTVDPSSAPMPFLPWLDVQSNNPLEIIGIFLFFAIAVAIIILYWKNKSKQPHDATIENYSQNLTSQSDNHTYLDDHNVSVTDIKSTKDLPKGVRISLQNEGSENVYDATVINIDEYCFTVFINNDNDNSYNPNAGEKATFFADINNQRWSFTTDFKEKSDTGIASFIFNHSYSISITNKRNEPRLLKEVPALFATIPRDVVLGPVPVIDLEGTVLGNIPSIISDINSGGCAISTRSPLKFSDGDLAIVSFILPDDPTEHTIFSAVNNVRKVPANKGGGSILNLKFIKLDTAMDQTIKSLVNAHIEEEIIV